MNRFTTIVLAAAAGLWLAMQLGGPDEMAGPVRQSVLAGVPTADADRALLVDSARELAFVQAAALLGVQRGDSVPTRRVAAEQLREAGDAGDALKAVAGEHQVALQQRLGAAEREAIEQLVALPQGQFDRRFAELLAASHRRQIERLERAHRASADPGIRWWSRTALDDRVAAREQAEGLLRQLS